MMSVQPAPQVKRGVHNFYPRGRYGFTEKPSGSHRWRISFYGRVKVKLSIRRLELIHHGYPVGASHLGPDRTRNPVWPLDQQVRSSLKTESIGYKVGGKHTMATPKLYSRLVFNTILGTIFEAKLTSPYLE